MSFWIVALAAKYSAWPDFIATAPGVSYAYLDDFRKTRPDIFHKADSITTLAGVAGHATRGTQELSRRP